MHTHPIRTLVRTFLPQRIRQIIRRLPGFRGTPASTECRVIDDAVDPTLLQGWQRPVLAQRQQQAFAPLLQQIRATPRRFRRIGAGG